jgi:hypothetical protein
MNSQNYKLLNNNNKQVSLCYFFDLQGVPQDFSKVFRLSIGHIESQNRVMLYYLGNFAQIIELLYELAIWALRDLWTRLGPSEDCGQVLWDTL